MLAKVLFLELYIRLYQDQDFKIPIIDEISMVGQNKFNLVNLRMQEQRGCPTHFVNECDYIKIFIPTETSHDKWMFSESNRECGPLGTNLWYEFSHV